MPARHALQVEVEIFVSHMAAEALAELLAVIALARRRHEIVDQ